MVHYLDDFLLFNYPQQDLFFMVCKDVGFEEKTSKSLDDYTIDFTDMKLDIDKLETHLSKDKHNKAIKIVFEILI